jgi:hypothetical protein
LGFALHGQPVIRQWLPFVTPATKSAGLKVGLGIARPTL